jgi:hypothetical protein
MIEMALFSPHYQPGEGLPIRVESTGEDASHIVNLADPVRYLSGGVRAEMS